MEYKVVTKNTEEICNTSLVRLENLVMKVKNRRNYYLLKEAIKKYKYSTIKKSRATHPCQYYNFSNEVIKNTIYKKKSGHPPLSLTKEAKKQNKKLRNEKSRVAHPRQKKKCANLYIKKAGSHPVASLKYCTIKINYRHKKQKMSDGEYGYSIGPSPPGSALA